MSNTMERLTSVAETAASSGQRTAFVPPSPEYDDDDINNNNNDDLNDILPNNNHVDNDMLISPRYRDMASPLLRGLDNIYHNDDGNNYLSPASVDDVPHNPVPPPPPSNLGSKFRSILEEYCRGATNPNDTVSNIFDSANRYIQTQV